PASTAATNVVSALRNSAVTAVPSGASALSASSTIDSGSLAGTASATSTASLPSVIVKSVRVSAFAGLPASATNGTSAIFSLAVAPPAPTAAAVPAAHSSANTLRFMAVAEDSY